MVKTTAGYKLHTNIGGDSGILAMLLKMQGRVLAGIAGIAVFLPESSVGYRERRQQPNLPTTAHHLGMLRKSSIQVGFWLPLGGGASWGKRRNAAHLVENESESRRGACPGGHFRRVMDGYKHHGYNHTMKKWG